MRSLASGELGRASASGAALKRPSGPAGTLGPQSAIDVLVDRDLKRKVDLAGLARLKLVRDVAGDLAAGVRMRDS